MDLKQQENSANTIIRFWRKFSSNRCLGCRLLLDYNNNLCHWCYEEENEKVECRYCGSMEDNAVKCYPFCDGGKCEKRYYRARERY
jgi:hypothetical protein